MSDCWSILWRYNWNSMLQRPSMCAWRWIRGCRWNMYVYEARQAPKNQVIKRLVASFHWIWNEVLLMFLSCICNSLCYEINLLNVDLSSFEFQSRNSEKIGAFFLSEQKSLKYFLPYLFCKIFMCLTRLHSSTIWATGQTCLIGSLRKFDKLL